MRMAALVALSALLLAADKPAAVVTKEATGEAAIVEGNVASAEKAATDAALRSAVEQVAGVFLASDSVVANHQLVRDRVLSHSAGYVQSYEVVSKKGDGKVVQVTVRAKVGAAQLDKDLAAVRSLIARMGNRKLVILLQEETFDASGVTTQSGVMAAALTEAFKKDGWTVIDPAFAAGKLRLSSGVAIGAGEAKEIADLSRSEFVIYGRCIFRHQSMQGTMFASASQQFFPVAGEYELTVFAADSGSQLVHQAGKFTEPLKDVGPKGSLQTSYQHTAFDIAQNRGQEIVAEVRAKVLETLRDGDQNGTRLVMKVLGLDEYGAVQSFKRVLSDSVAGVREVRPGQFGDGRAQFDIIFAGSTEDLAERLGGKSYQGRRISVTGVTSSTIEVTLRK
jgi:hypothetical protein